MHNNSLGSKGRACGCVWRLPDGYVAVADTPARVVIFITYLPLASMPPERSLLGRPEGYGRRRARWIPLQPDLWSPNQGITELVAVRNAGSRGLFPL